MEIRYFLASSEAVAVATISVFMAAFKQNMLRDMEKGIFAAIFLSVTWKKGIFAAIVPSVI